VTFARMIIIVAVSTPCSELVKWSGRTLLDARSPNPSVNYRALLRTGGTVTGWIRR
jgi:hypothetical protein